jgi:hypothetical protein
MAAAGAEAASIAGDFDGDGRDDLAIGVIGQEVGGDGFAGALHVIYGGQDGLSRRDRIFTQDSAGIRERAEPGDQFAASLAAGDFDRDGRDDLAVGSPFESVAGVQLGGIVQILYGSPRGLTPKGDQLFAHGRGGLGGEPELFDVFAWALAAGDFGKGRHDDLAVSTIGATVGGQSSAGVVEVLHGSRRGLAAKRHKRFTQASAGIPDDPEAQDRFGWTLVPGDFGKSRRDDLAIGVPFESVGTIDTAGAVQILYSGRKGLRPAGGQLLDQLELDGGVGGEDVEPEPDDRFGESIAAGDFGRGARDDIAIGAPNEDVEEPTPGTVNDGGMVMVGYGSRSGVRTGADAGVQIFYEIVVGSQYTPNMRFGRTLAAANFGRSDHADLAMSLPAADGTSAVMAGAVGLISGSQTGIAPVDAQRFSQDSVGIAEEGEQGDEFGRFLAAGRFDGSGPADLAIGVPVESVGSVTGAGAVHVLRGTKGQGIVAEGSTLLAQGFAGLAGAAQEDEFFGTALSGPTSGVPWD